MCGQYRRGATLFVKNGSDAFRFTAFMVASVVAQEFVMAFVAALFPV